MDRFANYLFLIFLSALFVIEADPVAQWRIIFALSGGLLLCLAAFILKWLTLDGMMAAWIIGGFTFGIGGIDALILILVFFVSSILITDKQKVVRGNESFEFWEKERRNGLQVWANGFWFILFLSVGFMWDSNLYHVAAAGAIATATSDTWATELGSKRFRDSTYLPHNFQKVSPGEDGGVSISGTLGAFGGSILIGGTSILLYSFADLKIALVIAGAGFLGCIADSYLGASLQREKVSFTFRYFGRQKSLEVSNNFVNWSATGVGSVAALIINLFI